jgi:hypothetical protein
MSLILPTLLLKYQNNNSKEINYTNLVNAGKPIQAADNVMYTILDMYKQKYDAAILIEAGTYLGVMIRTHVDNFKEIHTLELIEKYYLAAKEDLKK